MLYLFQNSKDETTGKKKRKERASSDANSKSSIDEKTEFSLRDIQDMPVSELN